MFGHDCAVQIIKVQILTLAKGVFFFKSFISKRGDKATKMQGGHWQNVKKKYKRTKF